MKKEYIYLNINLDNEGVIKVGKTTKKPILRAKEMDRKSHNLSDWVVEKYWEVFDCTIAEKIAHYCLQEYLFKHEKRELFKINKEQAIEILDKNLTVFSCLMSKEEVENTFFENQRYIIELEAKIKDLEEEIINLKLKANSKKIDTQEVLLKQKQDVLELLAIIDDDDKVELENELLKIEKVLKVLSFNNSDNMLNDKDLFEFRLKITDEMLLEEPNNQKLLAKRNTLQEINTLFVASQFLEGENLENIKKLIIKLDEKSKGINS